MSPAMLIEKSRQEATPERLAFYDKLLPSDDDMKKAAEKNNLYNNAANALKELAFIAQEQKGAGTMESVFGKFTDNQWNSADSLRQKLIASMRVEIVGPGNPSNFEQELIQDIIPNPSKLFQLSSRNDIRFKHLAMMQVISHFLNMKQFKMQPTQAALDLYTSKFGEVLGSKGNPRKITIQDLTGLTNEFTQTVKDYNRYAQNDETGDDRKKLMNSFKSRINSFLGVTNVDENYKDI
jgi:hypothetical protein